MFNLCKHRLRLNQQSRITLGLAYMELKKNMQYPWGLNTRLTTAILLSFNYLTYTDQFLHEVSDCIFSYFKDIQ